MMAALIQLKTVAHDTSELRAGLVLVYFGKPKKSTATAIPAISKTPTKNSPNARATQVSRNRTYGRSTAFGPIAVPAPSAPYSADCRRRRTRNTTNYWGRFLSGEGGAILDEAELTNKQRHPRALGTIRHCHDRRVASGSDWGSHFVLLQTAARDP
jgi:hypothetical protein